jgi:hypothetical protein
VPRGSMCSTASIQKLVEVPSNTTTAARRRDASFRAEELGLPQD